MQLVAYHNTMNGARPKPNTWTKADIAAAEKARKAAIEQAIKVAQRERLLRQLELANEAVKQANDALRRFNGTSVKQIIERICRATGVSKYDVLSNRRNAELVFARHAVMYWACRRTGLSLPQIGRLLGGRDHTTILHGKRAYVAKRAKQGRTLRPVR
jgi:chromosomal replication initiator protein